MAHGTPDSVTDMTDTRLVRGGREPSGELVEEMTRNWEAIGGRSPLTAITLQQSAALQSVLDAEGLDALVVAGMRNWRPFIADAMLRIEASGARRIVGIPLAPQFSTLSVQKYMDSAQSALPQGAELSCVRSFHGHPLLIEAFAEMVRAAAPAGGEDVIFTAHSLPERVARSGDPRRRSGSHRVCSRTAVRPRQLSAGVSERGAHPRAMAGTRPFGQDSRADTRRRATIPLVVPIGFVCDHTEILFDIDVQASATARACGATLRRTASLNASPTFIQALAALVRDSLGT